MNKYDSLIFIIFMVGALVIFTFAMYNVKDSRDKFTTECDKWDGLVISSIDNQLVCVDVLFKKSKK